MERRRATDKKLFATGGTTDIIRYLLILALGGGLGTGGNVLLNGDTDKRIQALEIHYEEHLKQEVMANEMLDLKLQHILEKIEVLDKKVEKIANGR